MATATTRAETSSIPTRRPIPIAGLMPPMSPDWLPGVGRWGVEPLPAAGGFESLLEGALFLARFLAHVRSWQVSLPEGGGLLQGGPESVKNAASAPRLRSRHVA